jgi:hypothetical protein
VPPEPASDPSRERQKLRDLCPELDKLPYKLRSKSTNRYNCVAFSAGDYRRNWSPERLGGYYWPDDLPRDDSLGTIKEIFRRRGFSECESTKPEDCVEKIAFYADRLGCTHVARQMPGGPWASKMGGAADIEHDEVEWVECPMVGKFVEVMCRVVEATAQPTEIEIVRRMPPGLGLEIS